MRRGPQFEYIIINEKLNAAKFLQMPCSSPINYIRRGDLENNITSTVWIEVRLGRVKMY